MCSLVSFYSDVLYVEYILDISYVLFQGIKFCKQYFLFILAAQVHNSGNSITELVASFRELLGLYSDA